MQTQPLKAKSFDSLAFEHYLRTGERLTTAQFAEKFEKKFNPNHDELGRFTFGLGLGGGGGGSTARNANNAPQKPASEGSWTDKLRAIFEVKPATKPAAPIVAQRTVRIGPIAEVPEFPQKDQNSWRGSNDLVFSAAADFYNKKYALKPGAQGFRTPEFMKAWAMVESGGEDDKAHFLSDPFQVNKPGDYGKNDEKLLVLGLRKYQPMNPVLSAYAALEWLRHKARKQDANRRLIGYRSDHDALQRYNGNKKKTKRSGDLPNETWYATKVLQLTNLMSGATN